MAHLDNGTQGVTAALQGMTLASIANALLSEEQLRLVLEALASPAPGDQEQAAKALANRAKIDRANRAQIFGAGAIPPLVRLLRNGTAGGKNQAARALTYLAQNNEIRDAIAEEGALELLVALEAATGRGPRCPPTMALQRLTYHNENNRDAIKRLRAAAKRAQVSRGQNTAVAATPSGDVNASRAREGRCVVCLVAEAKMSFVHGDTEHLACCEACAPEFNVVPEGVRPDERSKCPVCRLGIDRIVRHFTA
ncbi:unnamed protein product [Pelagomonas calceolata]|uniref:RING-type domain-containing protein n=2 Tax=Pelagomonas calceolata TaxID=35677 RepID=A0A8J2S5T7_9STRA|nr:unnamed protein product [Pelagomonas calceolata]